MNRFLLLVAVLGMACLTTASKCGPTPPTPIVDAAPAPSPTPAVDATPPASDPFAGQIFDCTGLDTTSAQPYADQCGDSGSVGPCMNRLAVSKSVPLLVCGARDAEMAAFVLVGRGDAGAGIRQRAAALRAWFANENILLRSSP